MKANTSFSTVVMIVLVTGMVLLALGLWWLNASDRAARRKLAQQHESDVRFDHFGKE
jgi:ligand-binding sensor domain-containing protein